MTNFQFTGIAARHEREQISRMQPFRASKNASPHFTSTKDDEWDVHEATTDDIDRILRLQEEAHETDMHATRETILAHMQSCPAGCLVAFESGSDRCVGFVFADIWVFRRTNEASAFMPNHTVALTHNDNGDEMYIASLVVAPELRRKGLGTVLFNSVIGACRQRYPKCRSAVLMVAQSWIALRRLSGKRRFLVVDHLSNLFMNSNGRPENALVLRKFFGTMD